MHDFRYVSKKKAAPVKADLLDLNAPVLSAFV